MHETIAGVASVWAGIATASATLAWFASEQFKKNRELFYKLIEQHETKDESRFVSLSEQIKQLQLRNASVDGYSARHGKVQPAEKR